MHIETSRLLIRPFREEHGEAWLVLVNDSDRFLPGDLGRGYGTEAARVVLGYAFDTLRLDDVSALVMRGNTGTARVAGEGRHAARDR